MTALVAAAGVATGFLAATGLVLLLARRTPDDLTAVVDATREPGTWLRVTGADPLTTTPATPGEEHIASCLVAEYLARERAPETPIDLALWEEETTWTR